MFKILTEYLFNIIIIIPIVILLAVISLKISKKTMDNINGSLYTQIIEKIALGKDTNLFVIRIGKRGSVLVVSPNNTEKIRDLDEEELNEIIKMKKDNGTKFDISTVLKNKKIGEKNYGNIK